MYVKYSSSIVALSLCLSHRLLGQNWHCLSALAALLAACSSAPIQTQPQNYQVPCRLPLWWLPYPRKSRPCHLWLFQPINTVAFISGNRILLNAPCKRLPRADVERLLSSANYNEQVVSLDKGQPEFAKMPWEYIDGAASSGRVSGGQRNFASQSALLDRIENQYGVPASIVTAIWGMESSLRSRHRQLITGQ